MFSGQKTAENSKKEEFVCPTGFGNGNFADPATCRRFYQVIFVCQDVSSSYFLFSLSFLLIFLFLTKYTYILYVCTKMYVKVHVCNVQMTR